LKHFAEEWSGSYISRGALIVAAVALGLVVQEYPPWFDNNPNVGIGVSLKDLRRINLTNNRSKGIYND
jgi:hypothetical protein